MQYSRRRGPGDCPDPGAVLPWCTSSGTASPTSAPNRSRSSASATLLDILGRSGRFVIELWVPPLRRFPSGPVAVPFHLSDRHVADKRRAPSTCEMINDRVGADRSSSSGHTPGGRADAQERRETEVPLAAARSAHPGARRHVDRGGSHPHRSVPGEVGWPKHRRWSLAPARLRSRRDGARASCRRCSWPATATTRPVSGSTAHAR